MYLATRDHASRQQLLNSPLSRPLSDHYLIYNAYITTKNGPRTWLRFTHDAFGNGFTSFYVCRLLNYAAIESGMK